MAKITYPTPVEHDRTATPSSTISRGMKFEHELNVTNEYYRLHGLAVIYKKPTPVTVVKTSYPSRVKARITEAYYSIPSTTDYNGVYRGRYLDFEAKETMNLSFSFTHIYPHQVSHLTSIAKSGGIAFVIIHFTRVQETWILPVAVFAPLYEAAQASPDAHQSLSLAQARSLGGAVRHGFAPPLAVLETVELLMDAGAFPGVEPFSLPRS